MPKKLLPPPPRQRKQQRAHRLLRSTNVTLPYVQALAEKGWRQALRDAPHLRNGLNVHAGRITNTAVAVALGKDLMAADQALVA